MATLSHFDRQAEADRPSANDHNRMMRMRGSILVDAATVRKAQSLDFGARALKHRGGRGGVGNHMNINGLAR